jgi:hypothetical protein
MTLKEKYENTLKNIFGVYYEKGLRYTLPLTIFMYIVLITEQSIIGVLALTTVISLYVHINYREVQKWKDSTRTIKPEDKKNKPLLGGKKDESFKEQLKDKYTDKENE